MCTRVRPAEGLFHPFIPQHFQSFRRKETVFQALKYRKTLKFLGVQLLIVCTPAISVLKIPTQGQVSQLCLIKDSQGSQCKISGRRSAILSKDGKLLRYKGCGMEEKGFTLQEGTLKGCHFHHTLFRQLLMTHLIDSLLLENGLVSGNYPLGFIQYGCTPKDQAPLLPKYCGVFKTLGDRRLGTHLLAALEALLQELLSNYKLDGIKTILDSLIAQLNLQVSEDGQIFMFGEPPVADPLLPFFPQLQKHWLASDRSQKYFDLALLIQSQLQSKISVDDAAQACLRLSDQKIDSSLIDYLTDLKLVFADLVQLYSRIGMELGKIRRVFLKNQINWGFFVDHGINPHCNAHLNNFILLSQSHPHLVAPLDFDLAFFRHEFIDIEESSATYGLPNDQKFQAYLQAQNSAFQFSVLGLDYMTNFKYACLEPSKCVPARIIVKLLRCLMLQGYGQGVTEKGAMPDKQQGRRLIEIGLTLSNKAIT